MFFVGKFITLVNGSATVNLNGINPDTSRVSVFNQHGNSFYFVKVTLQENSFIAQTNDTSLNGIVGVNILYKF